MSGLWGGIVGGTYQDKTKTIDPSPITVALIGDSFARWNSTLGTSPYYNRTQGYGWMSYLNMMTANRYNFPLEKNFGEGGYTTQDVYADLPSFDVSDVDLVMLNVGTNNIGINFDEADTIINGKTDIRNYLLAEGVDILDFTITPRADGWGGNNVTIANSRMNTVNDWTMTGNGRVRPIDMYEVIGGGTDTTISGMLTDNLHPSQVGAFTMAKELYDVLLPVYGLSEYSEHVDNVLDNTDFSGIGGTVGSNATGQLADNHVVETTGTTDSSTRTFSKIDGAQQIAFSFPSGLSATESVRIYQQGVEAIPGSAEAYYEVEFEIAAGAGNWIQISAEVITNEGIVAIGNAGEAPPNVGNPGDPIPYAEMINFQSETGRRFVLRTPVADIGGATLVRGRFSIYCDCVSSSASGTVLLHREQLVVY
jgi:lysophospholipase L1-like esterase